MLKELKLTISVINLMLQCLTIHCNRYGKQLHTFKCSCQFSRGRRTSKMWECSALHIWLHTWAACLWWKMTMNHTGVPGTDTSLYVLICWFCTFYSQFSFERLAKLRLFVHLNSIILFHVNIIDKKRGLCPKWTKKFISKLYITSYQLPQPSLRVKLIYSSNPKSRGATIQTSCI